MSGSNKADKQYGLILPKKQQIQPPKLGNVFGEENGSDEDDGTDWVKKALKAESEKNKMKKQTKLNMQKALKEDPTIYQYDEVYEDMERGKAQKITKQIEKKPKYIQNLLKAAERRKKEQEHRIERMVQKEREAEGTMFADKESFVTSAYRAKLEEFKKLEEEEARMNRLEAIGDVTKQQDISGFYRHLYEQTVENPNGEAKEDAEGESECNETEVKSITDSERVTKETGIVSKGKKSRQYRRRVIEADDSDTEEKTVLKEKEKETETIKSKTQDKQEFKEPEPKKQRIEDAPESRKPEIKQPEKTTTVQTTPENTEEDEEAKKEKEAAEKQERIERIAQEKKERAKIWVKRTVGPVFDAALQRYYARKALRLSGS